MAVTEPSAPAPKASMMVANDLRERIAGGEFKAGDALPVEKDLEAEYGMSTPVVRAALRILESHGLVEIKRGLGGGPRVRHPTLAEAAQGITLALQLADSRMSEVYLARDRIVAAAIERLAQRGTPIGELEAAVADLDAGIGDVSVYFRQLVEVGDVAVRLAGNSVETLLVETLRHIVTHDLAMAADEFYARTTRDEVVHTEAATATAWRLIVEHVSAGRATEARTAYEAQAAAIRGALQDFYPDLRVADLARARRSPT